MSIFNIFKRKPEKITIEVMGNTYEATKKENAPSEEERERMASRRQERDEKARRMELRSKWMAISTAFSAYRHFIDTPEASYPDDHICTLLKDSNAEMQRLVKDADFEECIALATDDYTRMNGEKPSDGQIRFATAPDVFNTDEMIRDKWLAYISGYRDYWEEQIGSLKRKNAVINRRKYLLEQIDTLLNKVSSLSLGDAAESLREYRKYNEQMLTK